MIDSQILKSNLHILLNFECFLLPRTKIYLVQMICMVSLRTLFLSFWFSCPACSFCSHFLYRSCLSHYDLPKVSLRRLGSGFIPSLKMGSGDQDQQNWQFMIKQVLCLHQPGPQALTPVSLAQTCTPACPAAQ